ncbi:hypothetical protein TI03_04475 [Achromatium sp. WMS1]|nr:hypothetical protein TI03_04475 [Achromatium sp. WMS1]
MVNILVNTWQVVKKAPTLTANVLHVWYFPESESHINSTDLSVCSSYEQVKAAKLYSSTARLRSLYNWAYRRQILSSYLGVTPDKIQFQRGAYGKPYIRWPPSALQFNMSHSGSLCLLAVYLNVEIGLDLEKIQPRSNIINIARRVFTPQINTELMKSSEDQQMAIFYYHWTRLEATVKANGSLLFANLNSLQEPSMSICNFIPAMGFQGCIAARTPLPSSKNWRYLMLIP